MSIASAVPFPPRSAPSRAALWTAGVLLVLGTWLAYANSFSGAFVFDDPPSLLENATLRDLSDWRAVLSPPASAGVGGRPVANLSYALNYALSGHSLLGYHLGNVAIHTLGALTLFGLLRRTLLSPLLSARFGTDATWLAFAVAALWAVHPVQTNSVTYLSQRTEALMGLFYLLTLYAFVRGATAPAHPYRWHSLAVVTCALGMASKEVMVTAPVVVALYDRTFFAGSFAAALRRRWPLYLGLAATWILLGWLMIGLGARGVGFGFRLTWWGYAAASCYSVITYLRLALWPHPLVFDYGPTVAETTVATPYALLVALLVGLSLWALWRRPLLGFLGAWFFVILAPTSSVVPIVRQMVAENRLYLPLIAPLALVVLSVYLVLPRRLAAPVGALVTVGFIALTVQRQRDYRSEISLWSDTVVKRPENWRAHNSLALALANGNQPLASIAHYQASLRLDPTLAETHNNLGTQLTKLGRLAEAVHHLETALRIEAWRADTHTNLGNILAQTGRPDEAVAHFESAVKLDPKLSEAHTGIGNVLLQSGRPAEAVTRYHTALALNSLSPDAHNNLGQALMQLGRPAEGIPHFQRALELRPDSSTSRYNLGNAFVALGRTSDASIQFQTALRLDPANAEAANNLAIIHLQAGQLPAARQLLETAIRLNPGNIDAGNNLTVVLLQLGLRAEARTQLEALLQVQPGHAETHYNLALLLNEDGLKHQAREHLEATLRLKPDHAGATTALQHLGGFQPAPPKP